MCVHGLSGSSRWWSGVAALIERRRPVVPLDVPRSHDRYRGSTVGPIRTSGPISSDDGAHTCAEAFAEEGRKALLRRSLERGMAVGLAVRENVHIGT